MESGLLMFLVLPLTLVGCGGDDDGSGTDGTQFVAATASSLTNQSFPFPTGLTQILPPALACPLARRFQFVDVHRRLRLR